MGRTQINPSYAFVKFNLEFGRVNSIMEILNDLDTIVLAKDLGVTLSEMDSLIKKPSKFSFETLYKLSLLFECDYKKLVQLIANYTLDKQMKPPKKKK